MALNPAYAQQSTRKLPFCVGYCYAQGDLMQTIAGYDGTTTSFYALGRGEWDGMVAFSPVDGWPFLPGSLLNVQARTLPAGLQSYITSLPLYYHFHGGGMRPKACRST